MNTSKNQYLNILNLTKVAFVFGLISVGFILASNQAQADQNVSITWIQDNPGNCFQANPNSSINITWTAEITNSGPGDVQIEKAAFHNPISGCSATSDNLDQSMFNMSGETYYSEGETSQVSFNYNTNARTCGRVQVDAGYFNPYLTAPSTVFLGEIIDYGVDCPSNYNDNGQILISSNVKTSWTISGPETFTGTGTFGSYTAKADSQDYFISVPNISGYKYPVIRPGINQTLYKDQTISFDIYYEDETPTAPTTGGLEVISNIPTTWTVTGPDNFTGTGSYGFYTATAGTYTMINVPNMVTYSGHDYSLASINHNQQILIPNTYISFTITYTQTLSLNPPTITSISNQQCGQLNIQWRDNSDNENGFRIYRSEQEFGGNYAQYQLIATLNANTTSYIDRPALNQSFYYVVVAFTNSPAMVAASQAFHSAFNTICAANIQGVISIYSINGNTEYNLNGLKDNDVVTFQIVVDNMGPSEGHITKITDQLSQTLTNARNLTVSGPNSRVGSPTISGNSDALTFNVSGTKQVGGLKWLIRYDTTLHMSSTQTTDQLNNCATVHYFDDSGTKTRNFCVNKLLLKPIKNNGTSFREVAP